MKRPFDAVLEIFSNNLTKAVENDRKNQEFLHQFTIWLLGFAIAALYLIASSIVNLKTILPHSTIKVIVLLLTISAISGIVHRIFLYLFQVLYNSNVFYAEGAFSNNVLMQADPVDVSNETDIQTLVNLLKNDFDQDDSAIISFYQNADVDGRLELIEYLRKKYTDFGLWAKRDYEIAFNHVNEIFKTGFGISDKEIKRLSQLGTKRIKFYRYAFTICLYICCLSFIIALLILAIKI